MQNYFPPTQGGGRRGGEGGESAERWGWPHRPDTSEPKRRGKGKAKSEKNTSESKGKGKWKAESERDTSEPKKRGKGKAKRERDTSESQDGGPKVLEMDDTPLATEQYEYKMVKSSQANFNIHSLAAYNASAHRCFERTAYFVRSQKAVSGGMTMEKP